MGALDLRAAVRLCGALLAANGMPTGRQLLWIVVCMISGRTAAMAFNRLVDARIDAANPRTRLRALPAGVLSMRFVAVFTALAMAVFVYGASRLNHLTLGLSPVALLVLLGYSYTKRFTRWSHLVLGLALGIAPSAAWIAVRGSLDPRIVLLTGAVMFWVAGFDVLYACQDYDFDCEQGLWSIPRTLGIRRSMTIARVMHGDAGDAGGGGRALRTGQAGDRGRGRAWRRCCCMSIPW